jgi:hypothetical protein
VPPYPDATVPVDAPAAANAVSISACVNPLSVRKAILFGNELVATFGLVKNFTASGAGAGAGARCERCVCGVCAEGR